MYIHIVAVVFSQTDVSGNAFPKFFIAPHKGIGIILFIFQHKTTLMQRRKFIKETGMIASIANAIKRVNER